jgi:hypothetical protein
MVFPFVMMSPHNAASVRLVHGSERRGPPLAAGQKSNALFAQRKGV